MSGKESEKEENVASLSSTTQQQSSELSPSKSVRNIPLGKPGPKCRKMLVDEKNEKAASKASEGETNKNDPGDVPDGELQEMFGELASSPEKRVSSPTTKVTTENLLSVLEDDTEKKPEQESSSKAVQPVPSTPASTSTSTPAPAPPPEISTLNGSVENKVEIPKISSKRYVYKLKSRSGKVLKYTSNTPIVLKRPVISLTKMAEPDHSGKGDNNVEDVDSDNSTKENMKDNEASGDAVTWTGKKRGRPPLSQKTPSTGTNSSDDRRSSDTSDAGNKTPSSYGVQTRKRQLKFLPDGRLLTPSKRGKTSDGKKSDIETASSDSDIETASDDNGNDSDYKTPGVKKGSAEKKTPVATSLVTTSTEKKPTTAKKKIFDLENYLREKINQSPAKDVREQAEKSQSATTPSLSVGDVGAKNKSVAAAISANSQQTSPSTPPKKVTPVDPAQLLSSLIGVPITPSQLNIVKFKPKVIQERSSAAATPKKVTIDDEKLRKLTTAGGNEPFKNTPFKVVSKTTFQKILPKPTPLMTPDRTPIVRRLEHRIIPATSTPLTYATIAPKVTSDNVMNESLSKFDNFTDSKVVKTKGGPKKVLKRNSLVDGEDSPKTVYDLLQQVFDQMPSWNLHVIPDTNHFCIAQVSRGRMGIPILKKSIELNGDFFAKVYVHQLHCKRYDGIYDTESKILSLIREIDALAA